MQRPHETLGRIRLQAILLLAVMFVIGALVGAALTRTLDRPARTTRNAPEPPPGLPPDLERELKLTPDQSRSIDRIFEAARPRTEKILDELMPRLREITDSVKLEVRKTLTPDQQTIFDRWTPPLDRPRPGGPGHRPGPGRPPGPPRAGWGPGPPRERPMDGVDTTGPPPLPTPSSP